MTYPETLHYLYTQLPMFSRMGSAAYKANLDNTIALCNALGSPERGFKSVHVAGTNGKGSVSHLLASVFQHAGYKTGLYTSPHLYDFRERIRINGVMVSEEFVVEFVEKTVPLVQHIQPSFFELTVAMAFTFFTQQKVDIAIIEVGLGGRLDSTNIISPELSVITNIGLDHTNLLGDTLQKIAVEKAGIIKQNVPVIIGERSAETNAVFVTKAALESAPITFAEDEYAVEDYRLEDDGINATYSGKDGSLMQLGSDLSGIYTIANLRTAYTAIQSLKNAGWQLPQNAISQGFAQVLPTTGLRGRWQKVHQSPTVILEVAHNPPGIGQMLLHLQHLRYDKLHLIVGMVKDKDAALLLATLPTKAVYYFTEAHIPRALPAIELQTEAARFGLTGSIYADVNDALAAALQTAGTDDIIIVCGSIFVVAEVSLPLVR